MDQLLRTILGHAHPHDDIQAYQTSKFVIFASLLISLATLSGFGALSLQEGQRVGQVATLGLALLLMIVAALPRLTGSLEVTNHFFTGVTVLVPVVLLYIYRNDEPAVVIWFPIGVIVTTFILGKRWGVATAGFFLASYLLFDLLEWFGFPFPQQQLGADWARPYTFTISFSIFMLMLASVCWLFQWTRERFERHLRESEARRHLLVEQMPMATIECDAQSLITRWNPAAEKIFGYSTSEVVGRLPTSILVPAEQRATIHERWRDVLQRGGTVDHLTNQNRTRDGRIIYCDWYNTALRNEESELLGMTYMAADVTERIRREEELRIAKEEAEAATRAKSEFLANMSHEIRTPMNGVMGMTSLLLETDLSSEQRDFVETIRNSSDALLNIINDILDFSKIESGRLELEIQPFDLNRCIEDAIDLLAPEASEKGLELAYFIAPDVPTTLASDVTRFRQILVNLLSNAVKFTNEGEVFVNVKGHDIDGERWELHVTVRDTGIGIPAEKRATLFDSFSQVDASMTRRYGGTGLGLAISKHLAEILGGAIWVESEVGEGSAFHFTIAAEAVAPAAPHELDETCLHGHTVLIVDDNETNRRVLSLHLARWGLQPVAVASAAAAMERLQKEPGFDVVLVDVQMAEEDGLSLVARLRKLPHTRDLPVVLLTSLVGAQIKERAAALDVLAYLTKPLKPTLLREVLVRHFGGESGAQRQPVEPPLIDVALGTRHPLSILLVEDNLVNQKVALRILERLGYRADVAGNGLEAIEAVLRQQYDLVLMDVQMPEMNGLDATREIQRQVPSRARPRVVAMTAAAMPADRERALAIGMDSFITKPVQIDELLQVLEATEPVATRSSDYDD